jgi:hypothetical protein
MEELKSLIFPNLSFPFKEDELLQAIELLPDNNKEAIKLSFLKKLSRKEIAAQLNWSFSKVHTKITRGITLLKYHLNPQYFAEMDNQLKSGINISSGSDSEHSQSNSGKQ